MEKETVIVRIGNYVKSIDPHPEGKHVILSVDDYNKLIRQLNCMRELLTELCTESQKKSTFFSSMHNNALTVIETE